MNFLRWTSDGMVAAGLGDDPWQWVTITLSVLVVAGYGVIALNWYLQSRLAGPESRAAAARLRSIVFCCAVCGVAFYAADLGWSAWRVYDVVLAMLAYYTWSFAARMRGLGLIDERLAQVEELERSAKKYQEIAELLPHVVWTATAQGHVDFSNQRWIEYAGAGRTWLDAVHPDDRAATHLWWRTAVVGGEPVTREIRLGGFAGAFRTFVIRATPIVHGDALKWLGACADIEDQKRLAIEKDQQARQKSFFLNALSHDLRAPLHNVVLNAHLLKMSARDADEIESVNMIVENAVAAGDLVTRLLDFARAGEDRSTSERVAMPQMLQQISRRFQPVAEQKGIYLHVDSDRDAEIVIDRQKLERIISNLVDNAIKFTDRGGVTLELVTLYDGVAVRIADTGVGIPESCVPYLFDEFYQVNNHERDRSKGFGIGLAICRSLARQLGGDVRLVSTGGGGSCFEIVLTGICADRGGRPDGEKSHRVHSQEPGLCRV